MNINLNESVQNCALIRFNGFINNTGALCTISVYSQFKKKYLNSPDVRQEFSVLNYVKHGK